MRSLLDKLADWLCERLGLCLRFDGDLTAPDGTEPWWPAQETAPDRKAITARALVLALTDDASQGWADKWVLDFLQADGWVWDGRRWIIPQGQHHAMA